jgi:hypothetical protein
VEPTMKDMARAAGWLQDHLDERVPSAADVESLSWLIAAARDEDKLSFARLCARVLAIDPEAPNAVESLRELQRWLCAPTVAVVTSPGAT